METWRMVAAAITLLAMLATLKRIRRSRVRIKSDNGNVDDAAHDRHANVAEQPCKNVSITRLPPGPRPLPVLGNLLQLQGSQRVEEKMLALSRQHGPLMLLWVGNIPTLIVNSPDMAMHFLKKQDKLFSHRRKQSPSYAISNLLYYGKAFYDPHGPAWKFLVKKQMFMEFLTEKQMQKYLPGREREFAKIMQFVRNWSLSSPTSQPPAINLSAPIAAALMNAATQNCCSKSYCHLPDPDELLMCRDKPDRVSMLETMDEWMKLVYGLVGETAELMTSVFIGDVLPNLSFLDVLLNHTNRKRVHNNFRRLDLFFQGLVDERRSQLAMLKPRPEAERDMLESLLAWRDGNGKPLSDTTIKGGFQFAVIGLTESLATSLEWTLAELLAHPEHLRTVYEELDAVVGREHVVRESDLGQLPFLRAVIKESWRLHPPAPISSPHSNPTETEVAGYHIPAHSNVLVNFYGIGRDPAVWPNPDRFMPQRFMDEKAARHVEANGQHMELLVFSCGKRQCLGIKLAPRIQGLLLARLLHSFHLQASPEHPVSLRACSRGLSHKLRGPLMAIPSPRLPPHLYAP